MVQAARSSSIAGGARRVGQGDKTSFGGESEATSKRDVDGVWDIAKIGELDFAGTFKTASCPRQDQIPARCSQERAGFLLDGC